MGVWWGCGGVWWDVMGCGGMDVVIYGELWWGKVIFVDGVVGCSGVWWGTWDLVMCGG